MQRNHEGPWLPSYAPGPGAGMGSGVGFNPPAHPLNSSINVQHPNILQLLQNPGNFPASNSNLTNLFIQNPNFAVQQALRYNAHQLRNIPICNPAFLGPQFGSNSAHSRIRPQIHGDIFSQAPQQFVSTIVSDDDRRPQVHERSFSQPKQDRASDQSSFKLKGKQASKKNAKEAASSGKKHKPSSGKKPQREKFSEKQLQCKVFSEKKPQHGEFSEKKPQHKEGMGSQKGGENFERIEREVIEARQSIIANGESVSAKKVSRYVLSALKVDSWRTLGVAMQEVPSLRQLMALEAKINAFVHCFIGVQRITTLYDLERAICHTEGIDSFEDLELGPLLQHPLVLLYFPSSGARKVFKITSEEIISYLDEFIDASERSDIKVDEFLQFITKKKSVTCKEKLGVRVQSLGMFVSFILDAKRREGDMLRGFLSRLEQKCNQFSSMRNQQDVGYNMVSQHVDSCPFVHKDFCGKHIRFDLSSSDDEDSNDQNYTNGGNLFNMSSKDISSSEHVSSCPYPSATEERKRLGLSGQKRAYSSAPSGNSKFGDDTRSPKKRKKNENLSCDAAAPSKLLKGSGAKEDKPKLKHENENKEVSDSGKNDVSLSDTAIMEFVSTWKDACKVLTTAEVFEQMLRFYKSRGNKVPGQKLRKKLSSSAYPFVGLLNVAVTSIKRGMWDTIYDNIQAARDDEMTDAGSEFNMITVLVNKTHGPTVNDQSSVTAEEIIGKLAKYLEQDKEIQDTVSSGAETISIFGKLRDCEIWLAEQLNVQQFMSLGFGNFFSFVEEHKSLLPAQLQRWLVGDVSKKCPLEVRLLDSILTVIVSQASHFSMVDEAVTKENVSGLFVRQFPSVGFEVVENSMDKFWETVRNYKSSVLSKSVLFSASCFGIENSSTLKGTSLTDSSERHSSVGQERRSLASVTFRDALDVLLSAPLLSDLNSWSHWDLRFAPTFGPLLLWLLHEVKSEKLLCLVTNDSKLIRIDPSATADSFLEAALKKSAYHAAAQLASLISLSGKKDFPVSLLKCYAKRAFEVIFSNYIDTMEQDDGIKAPLGAPKVNEFDSSSLAYGLQQNTTKADRAGRAVARFLLDCLAYLPAEFLSFSTDILLSALRPVMKNAAAVLLAACHQAEQRIMLHEAGLSLGIVEWVDDYHSFCLSSSSSQSTVKAAPSSPRTCTSYMQEESKYTSHIGRDTNASKFSEKHHEECPNEDDAASVMKVVNVPSDTESEVFDPSFIIESIRRDEFGLDSNHSGAEKGILQKQHARLGRALQCLSQELYSQDSHFILELVQNADDNIYPECVEPTLAFILQKTGICVLNNERGFLPENIQALCDVGRSTKKGCRGYIGKKGIGFKSVFRVSDAPEIHSNGFHIKFDISEGQIGFVLPTAAPPCDIDSIHLALSGNQLYLKNERWNTCFVLPFKPRLSEEISINKIEAMFTDLHPSLLLFLHRLQCIVYRNVLEDSLHVMRKEIAGDNIIKVSSGENYMTWFVASQMLHPDKFHLDVQSAKIAIAIPLDESDDEIYRPCMSQQPVFAFLPLRTYGLKFILQGDFFLTSSREEVDEDSPWNQWLLSEFPSLFVHALQLFCNLLPFREKPGRAVGAYMSIVPLVGEVHGFFSCLPRKIISKLRMSSCLLLEGDNTQWVPPCKVLRGWNEHARALLSDNLLHEHLGLGFLNKDIDLTDSLSMALGIEDYGPKVLVQILRSLSLKKGGLKAMGLSWLSSFLVELYTLSFHSSGQNIWHFGIESDLVADLRKIPFIPLSDGTYSSEDEGVIWLHYGSTGSEFDHGLKAFPQLLAKLRTVDHLLLSAAAADESCPVSSAVESLIKLFCGIGVQKLSAHEIIKVHILPALFDDRSRDADKSLIVDYICFVMIHLQYNCHDCNREKGYIISKLKDSAYILTNHGVKRPSEVAIHFSKEYENHIDVKRLINNLDILWHEVDTIYLKHPSSDLHACGVKQWKEFFKEIGVTDFVQVIQVDRSISYTPPVHGDIELGSPLVTARDWESPELVLLLSLLSKSGNRESCKYLLEVVDMLWDDYFSDKTTIKGDLITNGNCRFIKSSFMSSVCNIHWVAASMDDMLHCPRNLFFDCDEVRSLLGSIVPYAVPKVKSSKLLVDIGFKTKVTLDDTLEVLEAWRRYEAPFKASISQMTRFYKFIWSEIADSKQKITEKFRSAACIFVPRETDLKHGDVVSGVFLSLGEVCWQDPTGSIEQTEFITSGSGVGPSRSKTLCNVYPGLHDFFVNECGVLEMPSFADYLQILLQLSRDASPLNAAKTVYQVFLKLAEELKSGQYSKDVLHFKEKLADLEFKVLPTEQEKWVSLHPSYGLVCWYDDENLWKKFRHKDNIQFIYFGELGDEERRLLDTKVSLMMHSLGIPSISEVVSREAQYEGQGDNALGASLVNWALPYAQRYIYSMHHDVYYQVKRTVLDKLKHLQVLAVENLSYRYVIDKCGAVSRKRFKCNCLLQDDCLYTTPESDSHSLFLELSRLFVNGSPDLHLANFLHMITTMAESGLNEEQVESFILNSQKVQKLPNDEAFWFLGSAPKHKRKSGSYSSWPALKSALSDASASRSQPSNGLIKQEEITGSEELGTLCLAENNDGVSITGDDKASTAVKTSSQLGRRSNCSGEDAGIPSFNLNLMANISKLDSPAFSHREQLYTGTPGSAQALQTGRLGEQIVYKYLCSQHADGVVRWINETKETGLPYDIVIEDQNGKKQYIEVKATMSATKDWFNLSVREWQFAHERGECYSIAHVVLGHAEAILTQHRNPVKLCQEGKLRLVILMPTQQADFTIIPQ